MRIVVTGMGVVSPLGNGLETFWTALCGGACGLRTITRFDLKDFSYTQAGEVAGFQLPPDLGLAAAESDPATQFMLAAALEAMRDARLAGTAASQPDIGVVLATNFGGMLSGERVLTQLAGKGAATGADFSEYLFQSAADRVANVWRLGGPRLVLSLSCSSGTAAIGHGMELIRAGRAKAVLTGGYDALSRFAWSGLSALRTMSKTLVRPFDKNRDGTIFSEGAGALVIEELEHARQRGATIYAEVAGHAENNNAFHMTAPAKGGAGSALVMLLALADAGLPPEAIEHINAHGTGTVPNDATETEAIKAVFGPHACHIPVTAIKSMTGHMMGAAGAVEAIASILSIRDGVIPPTTNYRDPDPLCDLDTVANVKRAGALNTVLSNSAGIGGCNAAAIFKAFQA